MVVEANLSTSQQRQINICRIFLRAISPSDITTFDGKRVTQAENDGLRDPIATKIRWPSQQRPPKSWWDTWRNFLLLFSDASRFLLQPLGAWIEQEDCIHPWTWYLTEYPNTILERAGEQWFQHQKQGRGFKKYSKERHKLNHTTLLKAHEMVLVHISSIKTTD
jgi:hypothetical protein